MRFTYDRADQPVSMIDAATGSFVYNGNLKRGKQAINGKTIYSVYSQSGAFSRLRFLRKRSASLYRDNVTDNERTSYVGRGTGIRLVNGQPRYTHKDHLGSPIAETDASGNVVWKELYTPFGLKWTDPAANRDSSRGRGTRANGYTGHIDDDASGLTYMQARYYDPALGRFLANDPVGFAEGGPEYFNRYAYTLNNPVSFIDPDGTCTGSRLTNSDGTCKSTGGFSTSSKGVIEGSAIRQSYGNDIAEEAGIDISNAEKEKLGKKYQKLRNPQVGVARISGTAENAGTESAQQVCSNSVSEECEFGTSTGEEDLVFVFIGGGFPLAGATVSGSAFPRDKDGNTRPLACGPAGPCGAVTPIGGHISGRQEYRRSQNSYCQPHGCNYQLHLKQRTASKAQPFVGITVYVD